MSSFNNSSVWYQELYVTQIGSADIIELIIYINRDILNIYKIESVLLYDSTKYELVADSYVNLLNEDQTTITNSTISGNCHGLSGDSIKHFFTISL